VTGAGSFGTPSNIRMPLERRAKRRDVPTASPIHSRNIRTGIPIPTSATYQKMECGIAGKYAYGNAQSRNALAPMPRQN